MKIKFKLEPIHIRQVVTQFLENGLFWVTLVLITIGGVTTFYYQGNIALRTGSLKVSSTTVSNIHKVGEHELPISSVQTEKKQISLTFDVTGRKENLHQILETLSKYNVKASFFLTGSWLDENSQEVTYIAEQGHDLGNSTENHKNMSQLDKAAMKEEILQLHNRIKEQTGLTMYLFRPPYGDYNNEVITTAKELNYLPVTFNIASHDWKDYGAESLTETIIQNPNLGYGSIIQFHTGAKYTPEALEAVIIQLQGAGYQFVPLSQLLLIDHYYLNQKGCQIPGPAQ